MALKDTILDFNSYAAKEIHKDLVRDFYDSISTAIKVNKPLE
jgi:hypothetical protein